MPYTLDQIDRIIRAKHAMNTRPRDIGHDVGRSSDWVRERMAVLGITVEDGSHDPVYQVHPMWREDNLDARRQAIWKHQHDGAAKTLSGRG